MNRARPRFHPVACGCSGRSWLYSGLATGAEIRTQFACCEQNMNHVIVDVGGRDTASLRAALTMADTVIVPVLPASFDIWSLEPLGRSDSGGTGDKRELEVSCVLNAADAQGRDNDEAAAIIREKRRHSSISRIRSSGERLSAMLLRPDCRFWSTGLRTRRRSMNLHFLPSVFLDTLAISFLYLMPIAKHPVRKTKTKDKQAEKFIMAALRQRTPESRSRRAFIQTPIRFPKELLERIDWAAKKKGFESKQLAEICSHKRTGPRGAIDA